MRIGFENLEHLPDFLCRRANDRNYCRDKDISNAGYAACDCKPGWHPEARQNFFVTPIHEFLYAYRMPFKSTDTVVPSPFAILSRLSRVRFNSPRSIRPI